jgi:hypothetical protein
MNFPFDSAANWVMPTSTPIFFVDFGNGNGMLSKASVANHPLTALLIEQVLTTASTGSLRLSLTLILPTFETDNCLPFNLQPSEKLRLLNLSLLLNRG